MMKCEKCTYSKSMDQKYPRECVYCGTKEVVIQPKTHNDETDLVLHCKHYVDNKHKDWWVITSPQHRGLFLADPDLATALSQIPSALALLKKAEENK